MPTKKVPDESLAIEGEVANMMREKSSNRTYEIITSERRFRIVIPDDWKITFGPFAMGAKGYGGNATALRIYESETKQRAVYTNVLSFRDMSLTAKVAAVREKGTAEWLPDTPSTRQMHLRTVKESELERSWVDEEDIATEPAEEGAAFFRSKP